jgi:RimJ/RimL family protein N-acetyltransferase
MSTTHWTVTLPGSDTTLHFEKADPDVDAPLLHDWLHRPHVAPWWGADRDVDETRAYLTRQWSSDHLVPWIVSHTPADAANGNGERPQPFGYVETYRPADDPLANWFPVRTTDRGWHVLVGPPDAIGTGLPRLMGRAVLAWLLSEPGIDRVICEPNELNGRMLAYCKGLGYQPVAAVDLPTKRALILACTRAAFLDRWPDDLASLADATEPAATA